jgi:two-component system chemotaxis response regulator CheY
MALHLLLVEDKERTRAQIIEILAGTPYQVSVANDGLAGLNHARDRVYDIVLIDHKMPLMDGLALLRHLREQDEYAQTPILFMTTEDVRVVAAKATRLGADAVLAKPVDSKTLLAELNRLAPRDVA